ncbi:MAG: dihydrolipoamide acetyltransferase family protein [Chloroflexota bacterium]
MAEFIVMPTLGFDMEEGTMGPWLKEIGDTVAKGDILAEIESDKVTQELQARADGVLLAQLASTGDNIPVGAYLGVIGAAGEDVSAMVAEAGGSAAPAEAAPEPEATPAPPVAIPAAAAPVSNVVSEEFPSGVKATPVARRIAQENGVNLTAVSGTGPNGRIRKADVEAYLASPPPAATPTAAPTPAAAPTHTHAPEVYVHPVKVIETDTEVETSRLRQAIARRMTESKTTVPHFQVTSEIDMAAALDLRKQINAALAPEQKVSVNDLVVKAAALALREYPNLNASFGGDKLIRHNRINVGSAVAVEGGLLTVVQKDTDSSTISKIASDHKEMIGRARSGKVHPEDVSGSTFTVSNLGPFEVESFTAIINPPEAAILAVASARKVPVVVDDELAIGIRMKATVSADHRVTDGAEAAQFMKALKDILENPMRLLL